MSSHRIAPSIQVQLRRIKEALRWRYRDDPPCYGHGYAELSEPTPFYLVGKTGPELIDSTHITAPHIPKENR